MSEYSDSIDRVISNNWGESFNFFKNGYNTNYESAETNLITPLFFKNNEDEKSEKSEESEKNYLFNKNSIKENSKVNDEIYDKKGINDEDSQNLVIVIEKEESEKKSNNGEKSKKICFNCQKVSSDKEKLDELEKILKNHSIIEYKNFEKEEINENVIKDMKYSKKRRKRRTKFEMEKIKEIRKNNKIIKSKGRKTNIEKRGGINNNSHNKHSTDNIIKKVKCKFFEYVVKSVNQLINKYKTKKNNNYTLLNIAYKYVNILKKDDNIELLKKKLKEILSLEICPKYNTTQNYNEIIINNILDKEKDNEVINYIMNLTFKQWIVMFRNNTEEIVNGNVVKFGGIEEVLKKIKDNNKENGYINNFILILNKYEDWFNNKKGRIKKNIVKKS